MIVFRSTEAKVLQALEAVAGIVSQRHALDVLDAMFRRGSCGVTSGMMSGTICDGDADCSDATGADSAPAAAADDDDGGDPDPEPARRQPSNTHPQAIAPSSARASERGTATATAGKPSPRIDPESELWRLPAVLAHVPISRSGWFAGVRSGRYPKPVRLSERRVAWRASDIRSFVAAL